MYESGGYKTVVVYILVRRCDCAVVRDITVIGSEACIPQHKLMACVDRFKGRVSCMKRVFVCKCKISRLKEAGQQYKFSGKFHHRSRGKQNESRVEIT